jgi:hypothetical protein
MSLDVYLYTEKIPKMIKFKARMTHGRDWAPTEQNGAAATAT